jgi:hypothetical protein
MSAYRDAAAMAQREEEEEESAKVTSDKVVVSTVKVAETNSAAPTGLRSSPAAYSARRRSQGALVSQQVFSIT